MTTENFAVTLCCAAQTALLDEVTPVLRGVTYKWDDDEIVVRFIVERELSEEERNDFEAVCAEIAACSNSHMVESEFIVLPKDVRARDYGLESWAFLRKET